MKIKSLLLSSLLILIIKANAQGPELWGTTQQGGGNFIGTIFKINGDGTGFNLAHSMTEGGSSGNLSPVGNSSLYGLSVSGGTKGLGSIFRYDVSDHSYHILFSFDTTTGKYPRGSLFKASNGKYYGTTSAGGPKKMGTLFSFDPSNNTFEKIHDCDTLTGYYPSGNLIEASNGKLYGLMESGGHEVVKAGCVYSLDPSNNTYTDEYDFLFAVGFTPLGNSLVPSLLDNKLYGMTFGGGAFGYGVIFSFNPANNTYALKYSLTGVASGSAPTGSLTDAGGNTFYGMTSQDGIAGKGTIFRFNLADSTFTKLHDFVDSTGSSPQGDLLLASDGNLYGTTLNGGDSAFGVVFSYNLSNNNYTVLHDCGLHTGIFPAASLIEFNGVTGVADIPMQATTLFVYPNPVQEKLTVIINATTPDNSKLKLCDLWGRIIQEIPVSLLPGENRLTLNLSNISKGIYLVCVDNGSRLKVVVE